MCIKCSTNTTTAIANNYQESFLFQVFPYRLKSSFFLLSHGLVSTLRVTGNIGISRNEKADFPTNFTIGSFINYGNSIGETSLYR